jgi:hypothetical protein
MGRIRRSDRHRAQAPSKHKVGTRDKVGELLEENRKLRELVAHLSKLALTRIITSRTRRAAGQYGKLIALVGQSVPAHCVAICFS